VVKIQALVVNLDQSEKRFACMEGQLTRVAAHLKKYGVAMSFARYSATRIKSSTLNSSFIEHPACYPSNSLAPLTHPGGSAQAWRGVLGNACSHLKMLEDLSARAHDSDYYLILEDDIVFDIKRFVLALKSYLEFDPGHWTMLAFDTFDTSIVRGSCHNGGKDVRGVCNGGAVTCGKVRGDCLTAFNFSAPEEDRIYGPLDLHMFSTSWGYWGAHAWLVHDARVKQLWDHLRSIPTMPLDWYPKWSSQLHTSFISYQSGSVWQRKYAPPDQISTACAYEASSDILDAGRFRTVQSRPRRSSPSEVSILGMYNSGTNLLYKLFYANIEKPLNIELCKNRSGWAYCGRVWKHTHPKRLSEAISLRPDYGDFNQTIAIVLVRHPFSQIHSLETGENYDVRCGAPKNLPTGKRVDINHTCVYVKPTGVALQSQMGNERIELPICPRKDRPRNSRQCWENVAEGWNSYVGAYLSGLDSLFKQVKIIRYEDLVEAPERTMRDLMQVVAPDPGQHRLKPWGVAYEGASKKLDRKRSDALMKLNEKNYGANFTEDELNFLCSQLDKHLMGRLGYHGCTPAFNDVKHVDISTSQ
jgi:GR25 family glycosyltransferase involved in LPS biosynthesis